LGVSASTILRLIRNGQLPAIRIGRQWRVLMSDLRRGTPK
jgi:excisionase family DNA binding protein